MKRSLSAMSDTRATLDRIPGPRGRELVGALLALGRRPHEFLLELALRYGPIVCMSFPLEPAIVVSDPAAIQYMLHENYDNYVKQTGRWRAFRELVGDGLLTVDGDTWRRQRQRIQPAFHHERLAHFQHLLASEVDEMFQRWRTLGAEGSAIS
jgi:cytochrome P450